MKNVGSTPFLVPADKSIRLWTNLQQFTLHYNLQRILSGNSEDWLISFDDSSLFRLLQ